MQAANFCLTSRPAKAFCHNDSKTYTKLPFNQAKFKSSNFGLKVTLCGKLFAQGFVFCVNFLLHISASKAILSASSFCLARQANPSACSCIKPHCTGFLLYSGVSKGKADIFPPMCLAVVSHCRQLWQGFLINERPSGSLRPHFPKKSSLFRASGGTVLGIISACQAQKFFSASLHGV